MPRHLVYGLSLDCDRELPAPTTRRAADVRVRFTDADLGEIPAGSTLLRRVATASPDGAGSELCVWSLSGGGRRIRFGDGCDFAIDGRGATLLVRGGPTSSREDVLTYLMGPVAGHLLRVRGVPCLHAGAAEVDGRALVWVGPSGAGKSTLAAAFALADRGVIADDVVPIGIEPARVLGGQSWIKLWPAGTKVLFGSEDALPMLAPPWPKRFLEAPALGHDSVPIGAIYMLPDPSDEASPGDVAVAPLSPSDAVIRLVANSYPTSALTIEQRQDELVAFCCLATSVPVVELVGGTRSVAPGNVRDLLLRDFAGRNDLRRRE